MERQEHPDIQAATQTGYPRWLAERAGDTVEQRRMFAQEHPEEFMEFVLAGGDVLLEDFVAHYRYKYQRWLD